MCKLVSTKQCDLCDENMYLLEECKGALLSVVTSTACQMEYDGYIYSANSSKLGLTFDAVKMHKKGICDNCIPKEEYNEMCRQIMEQHSAL